MGSIIGKTMDENLQKQQLFMLDQQRIVLERQIQMQDQMRQRMMAMQLARSRDMFYWFGAFYSTAVFGLIGGYMKAKKRSLLAPLIPLTFLMAYQADLAYGSKMQRIKNEADHIFTSESNMLGIAGGLPTYHSVEEGRLQQREEDRGAGHQIFL